MIATDERRKAWLKFKEAHKSSGRDGTPSVTSFCAGWNMAMESLKEPTQPKTRTGYIVVNYLLMKEDYTNLTVFIDGFGKECIVVDNTFCTYINSNSKLSDVGVYDSREEARKEAYMNNEEDPEYKESVWKVELDNKNNIIKWIKKNP